MAVALPRSHMRVGIDRVTGLALVASLVLHGSILYAADRWGNCLCNVGKVVCPKLCDQKRLDLEIAPLPLPPPPPAKPKPSPKLSVVEAPKPKAHTAAPKRGRIVLPDEAFAKQEKPQSETTARLPVIPPDVAVKSSEVQAPVIATPTVFDWADQLTPGEPGEYGLGGTGTSTDPRASGTSPTSTEVGPELPAAESAPAPPPPPPPPPKPKGPSSPPRLLNWTDPPYPEQARQGRLRASLQRHAGFTISNIGPVGIEGFNAIISPPQTGILAVGPIAERPWAADGQLSVRPTAWLVLTVDHRVVDGHVGAQFLAAIKQRAEAWAGEEV